jgi:hypothetical protein
VAHSPTAHRAGFPSLLTIPRLPSFASAALTRHGSVAATSGTLCGVDEHAVIAAALLPGNRAIALSGDHFTPIEDRLAQGIVERSERGIDSAIAEALTFFDLRDLMPYPSARAASRDCAARRDGRGPQ